ncbi:MAG: pilus assembly protein, partial [Selenomonadaceae bacterium]|nr:pilus assembly protein [Selenomonadaceae bacterium]
MRYRKFFNSIKQRGQMLVLFALLIPIILIFVGLGIDIGWYYLNVSRLQNAADAAALAGSKKIVDQFSNEKMNQRYYAKLLTTPPSDLKEFTQVYYSEGTTSQSTSTDYSGNMQVHSGSILDRETKSEAINMTAGTTAAKEYTVKNVSSAEDAKNKNTILDSWNTAKKNNNRKVTLSAKLYSTAMDVQEKRNGLRYYEVTLTEDIPHFFLSGWFKPMKAVVKAYALLKLHATDMVTSINMLEPVKVIANWEYQNRYFNYKGKWNHYRQTIGGQKRVSYKVGDDFRTETVNVQQTGGSGIPTSANGNKYYSEDEVDSINIDFNQDVEFSAQFTTDWDLGAAAPEGTTIKYINKDGWTDEVGYDLRIQGLINLNYAWTNRKLKKIISGNYTSDDLLPDILWTRIESDPIWSKMPWGTQKSLDSVHQMIINVNVSNTAVRTVTDENGNERKIYEQR